MAKKNVQFTQVATVTLEILQRYMTLHVGEQNANELIRTLVQVSASKLASNPMQFPVCAELDMLGVTDYRQLTYQDFKILFRFDETSSTVYVMAFLRQRQSAQQLLIDYVIQADI